MRSQLTLVCLNILNFFLDILLMGGYECFTCLMSNIQTLRSFVIFMCERRELGKADVQCCVFYKLKWRFLLLAELMSRLLSFGYLAMCIWTSVVQEHSFKIIAYFSMTCLNTCQKPTGSVVILSTYHWHFAVWKVLDQPFSCGLFCSNVIYCLQADFRFLLHRFCVSQLISLFLVMLRAMLSCHYISNLGFMWMFCLLRYVFVWNPMWDDYSNQCEWHPICTCKWLFRCLTDYHILIEIRFVLTGIARIIRMELADKAVGFLLSLISLSIFTYYTFWVIILVSLPFFFLVCVFVNLISNCFLC